MILDAHAANPGDLDWQGVESLGDVTVYPRTKPEEVLERSNSVEIVLTNKVPLSAATLESLPNLRYIGVMATGYNIVDTEAAKMRGVIVTNVPAYSTASVAQLVFALLLEFCHGVGHHAEAVKNGRWVASPDFSFWDTPLIELEGKTLGILGLGEIGTRVAQIGIAMGMKVIAHTRTPKDIVGMTMVSEEELLAQSDVLTLHCPLNETTKDWVNTDRLRQMKRTAFLINTGRGPLVNEDDLAAALLNQTIAGAALDVLSVEPPPATNPLLTAPNCLITPHIGWATEAARRRLLMTLEANIRAYLDGSPQNRVA